MITDPIADFLTVIRNAQRARKERCTTRASKMTVEIARILKEERFIENYKVVEEGIKRYCRIQLKYLRGGAPAIRSLKRISTPGRRLYVGADKIHSVLRGIGSSVLSTPKGILTGRDAHRQRVGGELLCEVW